MVSAMKTTTTGRVMVIAAHPDDEVLGCGATVHKLVSRGWVAHLVIMSAGVSGRHLLNETPTDDVQRDQAVLSAQTQRAASVIGYQGVDTFDFPDNRMDTVGRMDLVHAIRPIIEREKPDLVLTHHPGDYNWDHTVTFDAVMMAARTNPPDFSPQEIWLFEVRSSTERGWQSRQPFTPTTYVEIKDNLAFKESALAEYKSELRDHPHPRSIEGIRSLAASRGHEVGMDAAEAFEEVRRLIR